MIKKGIFCVLTPLVLTFTFIPITSCNYNNDEYYQYIYDRTFSIGRFVSGYGTIGTGWLFYHISGYEYYMFTNLHVKIGQDDDTGGYYAYSYANTPNNDKAINGYKNFATNDFQYVWSAGEYVTTGTAPNQKFWGIDACVAKVNFGTPSSNLKTRLDKLNSEEDNHKLVTFSNQRLSSWSKIWMGGYPAADWSGNQSYPKWESDSDNLDSPHDFYSNNPKYSSNFNHAIDNTQYNNSRYISMSDQYQLPYYSFSDSSNFYKMGGGASGSMAINENKEVVGLYWGGYEYVNDKYSPCIEISHRDNGYDLYNDFIGTI